MQYIIGIDGGGTSTVGVIASTHGRVISYARSGPSNPNTTSASQLQATCKELIHRLKAQVSSTIWSEIIHVYAGVSGAAHPKMQTMIYDVLRPLCHEQMTLTVDHDAITALYAGTAGRPGIVQIAGTGSITYGVNKQKVRKRVGGWGHLISEKSSGYFIGSQGLDAAFASIDGIGGDTLLVEKFIHHFQVETLEDIVHAIYHHENVKEQIASLAQLVFQAADEGDLIARSILRQTGENIGEAVVTLSQRLFTEEERLAGIPLVLAGSIFKQKKWLQNGMELCIAQTEYPIHLVTPIVPPVAGAVLAAMLDENIAIHSSFVDQFQQTIHQKEG